MMNPTATYSPEDNKLRLYPVTRLDAETYARVNEAGFKWAPKQELFVAPMWTPARENLLLELCGKIGDEDTSLVDRAEERGERFEGYSDKRKADYEQAHKAVKQIADGIPPGQPILVGHHSERRARKDAERIENGMRKAVQMWETSEYWKQRAAGAIRAAKYKERPDVRARRIKKIEADKRKQERCRKEAETFLRMWSNPDAVKARDGHEITPQERAEYIANYDHISRSFPLADYPRGLPSSQYEGPMGLWSALTGGIITPEQAQKIAIPTHERTIAACNRWINHYENRLAYEKAMLEDQGASELLKPKARPAQLPLCNYRAAEGIRIENKYHRGEFAVYPQVEMTKAEYAKIHSDYKSTREVERSHRVRIAMQKMSLVVVFLTDSKEHPKPEAVEKKEITAKPEPARYVSRPSVVAPSEAEKEEVQALREQIKTGVQVVAVPQLFPTPSELAARMVDLAGIEPGERVLEPSAGLGGLLGAMGCRMFGHNPERGGVVAVEINSGLASVVRRDFPLTDVRCADFLQCNGDLGTFDKVVMNPPYEKAVDIKHIRHAYQMLRPGGRLVALCANGPRQREAFKDEAALWEDLPAGSFKEQGTGVNVALLVLEKKQFSLF